MKLLLATNPTSPRPTSTFALGLCVLCLGVATATQAEEYISGIKWQEPPVVAPGKTNADPPSDAVVLFSGDNLDAWEGGDRWKVIDGNMVVGQGQVRTKQEFGDCQLHVEWSTPEPGNRQGQQRSNSGVFFMAFPDKHGYEIQVLDSYKSKTYFDGQAGAVYKQTPPPVERDARTAGMERL